MSADQAVKVTIIRPVKGLEPSLYDCLASTFIQDYPKDKLEVRLCVSDAKDPAMPVLERVLREHPDIDAKILIESDDPLLKDTTRKLGPNPKIRNMSRAYREASADLIWIIDCNVWVGKGVCGRMVSRLRGYEGDRPYKYVHVLPIVVDTVGTTTQEELGSAAADSEVIRTTSSAHQATQKSGRTISSIGGGRLEEQFLASAHPKFYAAINTVLVAPCSLGKCTMYRKSHLNALTNGAGIDYFSENICEDQLTGDILWKKQLPGEKDSDNWGKHSIAWGDLAIQPMANMSLVEYWKRRVRWLRVRKFTVTAATFVEPGTESFLWAIYGAFAITTLPVFEQRLAIPPTWTSFWLIWLLSVSIWCAFDWSQYLLLHSGAAIEVDEDTPGFARPPKDGARRPFSEWLPAWLGREALALPIWTWAFWLGTTLEWRGKKFKVGMDMKVHEIDTTASPKRRVE